MKNRAHIPFNVKNRAVKKEADYYTPKKAFDQIIERFSMALDAKVDLFGSEDSRKADRKRIKADLKLFYDFYEDKPKKDAKGKTIGVLAAKGTPATNPAAPNASDFKIDVEKQIRKVIKTHDHWVKFIKRYIFDIEDLTKDEQHLFSGFEQRIGRLFIQAKIYPIGKYRISIRKDKVSQ